MDDNKLFIPFPGKTCRSCTHRQRWDCGNSTTRIIQYCGKIKSGRTGNGLLKIKVTNSACELYQEVGK